MQTKIIAANTGTRMELIARKLAAGEFFTTLWQKYGKPFNISFADYKKTFQANNPTVTDVNKLLAGKEYRIPIYEKTVPPASNENIPVAGANNRALPQRDFFDARGLLPSNPLGFDFLSASGIRSLLDFNGLAFWNIYKSALRETVPGAADLPKAKYEIPNAAALKGIGFGASGAEVLKLQKVLTLMTSYGPRFKFDGAYGNNMLGAILYIKYLLVNAFQVKASDIAYGSTDTLDNMKRSAEIDQGFLDRLEAILYKEPLNGKPVFVLPCSAEVLEADKPALTLLEEIAAEDRLVFPAAYYNAILQHESGASHFFKLDLSDLEIDLDRDKTLDKNMSLVTFGMDWLGWKGSNANYNFASRVSFNPANEQEPWKNSTGWGITQFTTFTWRWPEANSAFIYSKKANLRAGVKLFLEKKNIAKQKLTAEDKAKIVKLAGDNGLDTKDENIYWLAAIWFYNGYSAAGFNYLKYIVEKYLKK